MQIAPQRPCVVDADLVADRLEQVEIGVRVLLDAAQVAEQLAGKEKRRLALSNPARAVEEIGVSRPLGQSRAE